MTTKRTSDPSSTDSPALTGEPSRLASTFTLEAIRSLAQVLQDFELSELEWLDSFHIALALRRRDILAIAREPDPARGHAVAGGESHYVVTSQPAVPIACDKRGRSLSTFRSAHGPKDGHALGELVVRFVLERAH